MESATYSVVLSGNKLSGFESDTATSAFAEMLNLPPDKAEAIMTSRFVVEKEVELHVARTCKEKLAKIGVDALLRHHGKPTLVDASVAGRGCRRAGFPRVHFPVVADSARCPSNGSAELHLQPRYPHSRFLLKNRCINRALVIPARIKLGHNTARCPMNRNL